MSVDPRAVWDLLADLEVHEQRTQERDAAGWVVVTTDLEFDNLVHVTGPFDAPEAALIHAAGRARDDERLLDPGEIGWRHDVLPLYAP